MIDNKRIKNIVYFLISQGFIESQEDLSLKLGYSPSVVSQMINGKKPLTNKFISKLVDTFQKVNKDYLLTGEGSMLKGESPAPACSVPLIPVEAIAGLPAGDTLSITAEDCEQYHIPDFQRIGVEYLIRVSGSSMYPKYSNGDLLACRRVSDILFFQWGKVYVIDSSQGALVKRVFPDPKSDDYILLVSDNKEKYPPFSIPKTDIRSLSIVVGVVRLE